MRRSPLLLLLVASGLATAVGCIDVGSVMMLSGKGGTGGKAGAGGVTGAGLAGGGRGGATAGSAGTGSILLGDFENHTARPQDTRFANYQFYAYNPNSPLPAGAFVNSPLVAPGYNSNYGLGLNWEVIDVKDKYFNNIEGASVTWTTTAGSLSATTTTSGTGGITPRVRQQMQALQGLPEQERRDQARKIRETTRTRIREFLTPEQRTRYDESAAGGETRAGTDPRSGAPGRVYVLDGDKAKPVALTLGISDGTATEILRGDLKEGQEIIIGTAGSPGGRPGTGAPGSGGAPRLRL